MKIDFGAKLSSAIDKVFPPETPPLSELSDLGFDLATLFEDLRDAAVEQGIVVELGTTNEMRALLLTRPYIDYGSLTPVGPSLRLVLDGAVKKFCLGIDPDSDADGGDGMKIRLLSWTGTWPKCEFEEDLGVSSIDEFFDRLVGEIAVATQAKRAVSAIKKEQACQSMDALVAPGSTTFWDSAAAVLFMFSLILSASTTDPRGVVAGCLIAGCLLT